MLVPTNSFLSAARKQIRTHPGTAEDLRVILELMAEDAFNAKLKAHKLKGDLSGSWACSAGYDLRVVFQFVKHRGGDVILLETVGTQDEVY